MIINITSKIYKDRHQQFKYFIDQKAVVNLYFFTNINECHAVWPLGNDERRYVLSTLTVSMVEIKVTCAR